MLHSKPRIELTLPIQLWVKKKVDRFVVPSCKNVFVLQYNQYSKWKTDHIQNLAKEYKLLQIKKLREESVRITRNPR